MKFSLSARVAVLVALLKLIALSSDTAIAQTMTESLLKQDPKELASDARSKGDVVRGAILFHQGNINCAKCHQATSEKNRLGPDLSRMEKDATDQHIIESILQPSKTMKKGFETISILKLDGQFVTGIVVEQNDEEIAIRNIDDVDKILTLRREDVDEISDGKTSIMPEKLADQLTGRQQFLDLLRYVFEVRQRGPQADIALTTAETRRSLSSELNGLILISDRNCMGCHQSSLPPFPIKPKTAPRLKWSSKWLNPTYINDFIANPHQLKPGTTMPEMLGHLEEETRAKTANAITHFLLNESGNQYETQPINTQSVTDGFELFQTVGCVACHSPRNQQAVEHPLADSIPLGELAGKYSVPGLVIFLENPLVARPSGHMPNMKLTHREATNISNFLLQSTPQQSNSWNVEPALATLGKELFSKYSCSSCHTEILQQDADLERQLSLKDLNLDQSCLSANNGPWPNFHFDDEHRQSIRDALRQDPAQLTCDQQIEISLSQFNCIACHQRNDFGGVTSLRNPHFQTTNLNLGDQGRIPPTLTGVGAKLKSKWMRDVLVNGMSIRPYMKTRMPQYGEENIGHLVQLFQSTDSLSPTQFATFKDQEQMRKTGLQLAGNKGLNCIACHTYRFKLSDTMPAVDLTEMADRLKKDWFYQYMLAPQKFSPDTVMPSFWPGGVAIRKDLEGQPDEQIEALWQYLLDGRQAAMPEGVVREPMEIVVDQETKMLRRSFPGVGKRGIAVGYPHGINIVFDAEQMRLATFWKGRFVDPAGVWTGQGSGNARPMGNAYNFASGPDIGKIDNPWVADDGRPANYHFKGYILDELRSPTFRYTFESAEVKEYFEPQLVDASDEYSLRRSVSLSSTEPFGNLSFRIATGKSISNIAEQQFSIDDRLKVRIISGQTARIVEDQHFGQRLEIPLDLVPEHDQQLVIEYSLN